MFDDLAVGAAADRPALVNLVVNQCRLTVAAYPATISDLAALGYLAVSEHGPGNLMFGLAELPPDPSRPGWLRTAGTRRCQRAAGSDRERAISRSC
jgi:hypothetical protein